MKNRSKGVLSGFMKNIILRGCHSESHSFILERVGFTLIELLVVVLIIGILSAIALPQYTRAVEKAEVARMEVLAADALKAEKLYYLANGKYTNQMADLDLQWPQFVHHFSWDDVRYYKDESSGYAIGLGSKQGVMVKKRNMVDMELWTAYDGTRSCNKTASYKRGEWLCNVWMMGGK